MKGKPILRPNGAKQAGNAGKHTRNTRESAPQRSRNHPAEACLLCGKPLVYRQAAEEMTCAICREVHMSQAACEDGHFVCDKCHRAPGAAAALSVARTTRKTDPVLIAMDMMDRSQVHMHGPEHHVISALALLSAVKNAGAPGLAPGFDFDAAMEEAVRRGSSVPGGACGFWGACGAAIGTGVAASILTGAAPTAQPAAYGLCNGVVSDGLAEVARIGGPRCCKRNTFLTLQAAAKRLAEPLGAALEMQTPVCRYFPKNRECLGQRCPFFPAAG